MKKNLHTMFCHKHFIFLCLYWTFFKPQPTESAIQQSATGTNRIQISQVLNKLSSSPRKIAEQFEADRNSDPVSGFCQSGDSLYSVGRVFQERCLTCECMNGGVKTCKRDTREGNGEERQDDGGDMRTSCEKEYQDRWGMTCRKWSADGCCCEQEGCVIEETANSTIIPPGTYLRVNPERPCEVQHCDENTGRFITKFRTCRPPKCADAVRQRGRCCLVCPMGPNCIIPASKVPSNVKAASLLIPYSQTQVFDDNMGRIVCHCILPGRQASCTVIPKRSYLTGTISASPRQPYENEQPDSQQTPAKHASDKTRLLSQLSFTPAFIFGKKSDRPRHSHSEEKSPNSDTINTPQREGIGTHHDSLSETTQESSVDDETVTDIAGSLPQRAGLPTIINDESGLPQRAGPPAITDDESGLPQRAGPPTITDDESGLPQRAGPPTITDDESGLPQRAGTPTITDDKSGLPQRAGLPTITDLRYDVFYDKSSNHGTRWDSKAKLHPSASNFNEHEENRDDNISASKTNLNHVVASGQQQNDQAELNIGLQTRNDGGINRVAEMRTPFHASNQNLQRLALDHISKDDAQQKLTKSKSVRGSNILSAHQSLFGKIKENIQQLEVAKDKPSLREDDNAEERPERGYILSLKDFIYKAPTNGLVIV